MNNIDYFEYSQNNEDNIEKFINPVGIRVINENESEKPTDLMQSVDKLNGYITTYYTLKKIGKTKKDNILLEIIDNIAQILEDKNENINYSPFCIYFQVIRYSYSKYRSSYSFMSLNEKRDLIMYLLDQYIENRYEMYQYHGYSPIVLQVMSDSASSRRNGTIGIQMLENILKPLGFTNAEDYSTLEDSNYSYIDSDKKGKKVFKEFLERKKITFQFQSNRDNKFPDMLIKIKNEYFILEHKLTNRWWRITKCRNKRNNRFYKI